MTVWLVMLALLLAPQKQEKYDSDKLPYRVAWGSYVVTVEKTGKDEFAPHRVRILTKSGKVVREIQDQQFGAVEFVELDGKAPAELHVSAFTGGAHCCSTDYFFTQEGGIRNLLIFEGGNGEVGSVKDLNKDGRPEILVSSDVLAYFGDLSYAGSPSGLMMVLGWDGRQYVDQTRRYPAQVQEMLTTYRKAFLEADKEEKDAREEVRRMGAAGYYASMLTIGRGAEARKWLLARMPASTRQWLLKHEKALRAALAAAPKKIRVSQEKVLKPTY